MMNRTESRYLEGVQRITEQWPSLRYLGMGAWWAWIWLCYSGTALFTYWPRDTFAQQVGQMYLFSTPAIVAALVGAAIAWRRVTPLVSRSRFALAVSLLATLGSVLIATSSLMGGTPVFACGAVLTGLGTSVLALQTGLAYGSLGGREVLSVGSVALVFAAFLYFMGTGLPVGWQPAFVACMPPLGALLFAIPGDEPFPVDDQLVARSQSRRAPGMRSYVRLVAASSLVAATAVFAKGIAALAVTGASYAAIGSVTTFLIALAAGVICVLVNTGDIVRSVRRIYAALIFFGVAVVLLSAFGLDLLFISVGRELLWMMFTCLMAYTSFKFDFSPVRAFGFGQAASLAASAVFWWLGMMCAPLVASDSMYLVVVVAMVLVIVVTFVFVFTDADIKFIFTWKPSEAHAAGMPTSGDAMSMALDGCVDDTGFAGEGADRVTHAGHAGRGSQPRGSAAVPVADAGSGAWAVASLSDAADLEAHIAALPASLGVSSREAQVMLLFARGHSANWIAEDLVISKNTVRSHIRSIYTKLDVHSRRELLEYLVRKEP